MKFSHLNKISFGRNINEHIIEKYIKNKYSRAFSDYDLFEIGCATIEDDDGYLVCYDNNAGKVLIIYFTEQRIYDLNMSLYDLLNSFEEVY